MTCRIRLLGPVLAVLALTPVAVPAQQGGDEGYEALLAALADAGTPAEAQTIVPLIWDVWLTAPDDAAQEVLDAAMARRSAYDFAGALKHLNILIETYPDYAEGWNQRATVLFLVGDYEGSLADVDEVLKREPRHFGALAGRAMIYFQQGRLPLAQLSVRKALTVHPFLAERAILDIPAGQEL
ncbi:tetratricopeptide repeat protein [Psychromarinibacter sp. S121]|uniref:tetratricopeptide repeat protein n=1 Tax=Psychromarinibacter sp. S121 TaxID=3415127 RepID=UPI003C79BC39